jgi:hypothetical protein
MTGVRRIATNATRHGKPIAYPHMRFGEKR